MRPRRDGGCAWIGRAGRPPRYGKHQVPDLVPPVEKSMVVDFEFAHAPAYRVAYAPPRTEYKESEVRSDFERLARWASERRCRTGKWLFLYLNEPSDDRFQVAIEVRGRVAGDREARVRTLPASRVGRVTFDPEVVAPRVVFFGITDWLRWERGEKKIRRIVRYREVYDGNPWTNRAAWKKTTLQVVVR